MIKIERFHNNMIKCLTLLFCFFRIRTKKHVPCCLTFKNCAICRCDFVVSGETYRAKPMQCFI